MLSVFNSFKILLIGLILVLGDPIYHIVWAIFGQVFKKDTVATRQRKSGFSNFWVHFDKTSDGFGKIRPLLRFQGSPTVWGYETILQTIVLQ